MSAAPAVPLPGPAPATVMGGLPPGLRDSESDEDEEEEEDEEEDEECRQQPNAAAPVKAVSDPAGQDDSVDSFDSGEDEVEEAVRVKQMQKQRRMSLTAAAPQYSFPAGAEYGEAEDDEEYEEDEEEAAEANYRGPPRGFKDRLWRFFSYYEPSQLPAVDAWMANWRRKEHKLIAELIRYHGPEPSLGESAPLIKTQARSTLSQVVQRCRELLIQFFFLYAPDRVVEVDSTLHAWQGQEPELLNRLQRQARLRDYIIHHFSEHYPDRMTEVPSMLKEWFGVEAELVKCLRRDGIATPNAAGLKEQRAGHRKSSATQPTDDENTPEDPVPMPFRSWRDQLYHFYSVHQPEKASQVDVVLDVYKGREAMLFRKLIRKYTGYDVTEADIISGKYDPANAKGSSGDRELAEAAAAESGRGGSGGGASKPFAPSMPGMVSNSRRMDENTKHKIRLMCAAWNPDAAEEVGKLLHNFDGSEAELMRQLVTVGGESEADDEEEENSSDSDDEERPGFPKARGIVTADAFRRRKVAAKHCGVEDYLFPKSDGQTQTSLAEMDPVRHIEEQVQANWQRQNELNATLNSLRHRPLDTRLDHLPPPEELLAPGTTRLPPQQPGVPAIRPQPGLGSVSDPLAINQRAGPPPLPMAATAGGDSFTGTGDHELSLWLSQQQLGHLYKTLLDNDIVLECLPSLTERDLALLEIPDSDQQKLLGAAMRI